MHPDDCAKLLPPSVELDATERLVLNQLLSMTLRYRDEKRKRLNMRQADYDAAVARLVEFG